MYIRTSSTPILSATKEFYASDTEPCVQQVYQGQEWYHGTGVSPNKHPLKHLLQRFKEAIECGQCKSGAVKVIAMQCCVHPMSGDLYFDCEFRCEACHSFTAVSYSEN